MVIIKLKYNNNDIQSVQLSGHAEAGDYGHDLVCAAITGIVSGAMNALDINYKKDVEIKVVENDIAIEVINFNNKEIQTMMLMLKIQLDTIAVQYPKNVKIQEVR